MEPEPRLASGLLSAPSTTSDRLGEGQMGRPTGTTSDPVGGCGPSRPTRASTKVAAGSRIAERSLNASPPGTTAHRWAEHLIAQPVAPDSRRKHRPARIRSWSAAVSPGQSLCGSLCHTAQRTTRNRTPIAAVAVTLPGGRAAARPGFRRRYLVCERCPRVQSSQPHVCGSPRIAHKK